MSTWTVINRGDGRVELSKDGCGHPSERLSKHYFPDQWAEWMLVHGCNGECSDPAFSAAEDALLTMAQSGKHLRNL